MSIESIQKNNIDDPLLETLNKRKRQSSDSSSNLNTNVVDSDNNESFESSNKKAKKRSFSITKLAESMGKRSCVQYHQKKTIKEYNRVVNRFVKYDDLKKKIFKLFDNKIRIIQNWNSKIYFKEFDLKYDILDIIWSKNLWTNLRSSFLKIYNQQNKLKLGNFDIKANGADDNILNYEIRKEINSKLNKVVNIYLTKYKNSILDEETGLLLNSSCKEEKKIYDNIASEYKVIKQKYYSL